MHLGVQNELDPQTVMLVEFEVKNRPHPGRKYNAARNRTWLNVRRSHDILLGAGLTRSVINQQTGAAKRPLVARLRLVGVHSASRKLGDY